MFDFCHCGRAECAMHLGGGFQSICTKTWRAHTGLQNARWPAEPFGFAPDCVSLLIFFLWRCRGMYHLILIYMVPVRNNFVSKRKDNVNIYWYIKFKSRSNSDVFRAKYAVPPTLSYSVYFLCIYIHIYGDKYIGFSFLSCLYKWNDGVICELAFSHLTMS